MLAEKRAEFIELFREFAGSYPTTPQGQFHIWHYEEERKQGRRNFEAILEAESRGDDVTDEVLMKLLPYVGSKPNREMGYWISIASVFNCDVRKKFEPAGWTDRESWPEVAKEILRFVRRCYDRPEDLKAACDEFSNSPYSKGFQSGTLTPILHALRPDDFILITNKSRRVINYFSGTSYSSNLTDYPSINETARSLVKEISDYIGEFGISGIRSDDLFDMFTHWLVAIKRYDLKGEDADDIQNFLDPNGLSEPFANICEKIFGDQLEAEWAFDLLKTTLERLGIESLDDERFSITIPIRSGGRTLHLSFGPWLVLGFDGSKDHASDSVTITLLANQTILDDSFVSFVFAKDEDDPDIRNYKIPIDMAMSSGDEIFNAYEEALNHIANKFKDWKRSPWRNKHQSNIAEEIFDRRETSYWIFQSNPDYYDLAGAISELAEITWAVNQYKKKIHAKDRVYLWESGKYAGILAVATVLSDPNHIYDDYSERKFIRNAEKFSEEKLKVSLRIDHVLPERIRRTDLLDHPVLKSLEVITFPNATNFAVNEEQAQLLNDLVFTPKNPLYLLNQCAEDTGFDLETLDRWVRAIRRKGQAVLYGPPGTGKTYVAEHLARYLIGGADGFADLVQFHPAYAYEDFIQGIRPQSDDDGGLRYPVVPGRFLDFCERAESRRGTCVLIIDEINRANLSQVFGELMYLLEYRDRSIPLAGSGRLRIPENVLIIGTMNTADRSIALVDHALRRRFAFLRLQPNHEVLLKYHQSRNTGFPVEGLIGVLRRLNAWISDPHYEVGISFFLRDDLNEEIEDIWTMEIEPYLEEYFFDRPEKAEEFRWDKVDREIAP